MFLVVVCVASAMRELISMKTNKLRTPERSELNWVTFMQCGSLLSTLVRRTKCFGLCSASAHSHTLSPNWWCLDLNLNDYDDREMFVCVHTPICVMRVGVGGVVLCIFRPVCVSAYVGL